MNGETSPSPLGATTSPHPGNATNVFAMAQKALFTRETFLIALVFVLGLAVRWFLLRFELFFEFDSYWHARMVSYILQGLPAPAIDPLAYYQNVKAATIPDAPLLFWYISAGIYKVFTLNAPYHFELWVWFVKLLPALYGALTCVAMYFLGKAIFKGPHEKTAGLFAGILAAVVPSFVYRTMGGFFEDDSMGFLWMIIGFVFLIRATREPEWNPTRIRDAVLAGLSFGLMALTWSAFNQLIPILLGVGFVQFVLWLREGELERAKSYGLLWLISFVILAAFATIQDGIGWLSQFGTIVGGLIFHTEFIWQITLVFILVIFGVAALLWKIRKTEPETGTKIVGILFTVLIVGLVLAPLLVAIFNVSLQTGDVLGQSVGEESAGKNYFGNKYSLMILFAVIGIPAIGYLLLKRSRHFESLVLPLVWTIVVFFMAWGKLKFTFYWGLPLSLTGAVVLMLALKWMSARSVTTKKLVALGMGLMILGSVAAGIIFVTQNVPNIEATPGWKDALFWSQNNLPMDTKFFNWWDEGHWISFLSNRKVLIDNRNADPSATSDVAKFILSTDENAANAIIQKYGSTHLIFGDDLLEKLPNMGVFAYNINNGNDPRISGLFGTVFECQRTVAPLTKEVTYQCGTNAFTEAQMSGFPAVWQSTPNNLQNGTPFFIYRDADKSKVYGFTQPANATMLVRLWMGDPSLTHFREIYKNAGGVRIYEHLAPTA